MRWHLIIPIILATLARAETIAILPFANASGGAVPNATGMDWMGAGIAETVREALTTHSVEVLTREEVAAAYTTLRLRPLVELTQASILKLAEALRADRVLYGTFAYKPPAPGASKGARGTLTIRGRILRRQTFEQSAPLEEVGSLEDFPSLEAHLSWRALALTAPQSVPLEADFPLLRTAVRLDAEESYIRGLLASTPQQREKDFLQSARMEPLYWRPAFELGKIMMSRKSYREAATWLERVQSSDAAYAEASFLLGISKFHSGDTLASQEIFERLSHSVPSSAVFNNLGAAQSRNGLPTAAASFRKALETDPNDPDYLFNLAYFFWKTANFEQAAETFRAVLDRVPDDSLATLLLGRSLTKQPPRKDAASDARLLSLERVKESLGGRPSGRTGL